MGAVLDRQAKRLLALVGADWSPFHGINVDTAGKPILTPSMEAVIVDLVLRGVEQN